MHRRGGGKFRGGFRSNQGGERFQSNHDDRSDYVKPSEIKRRVSFKNTVRNYRAVNDTKLKAFLEDEDMQGEIANVGEGSQRLSGEFRRGGGMRRRKGSPIPRHVGGAKLVVSQMGWYQVTIQHGAKYDKELIYKLILDAVQPNIFMPHYYKIENDNKTATFFVDEYDVADKINKLDRKIELPDGFKMMLRVRGSIPQTKIDETLKERMKNVMGKRYNPATKALDLTKFHADPDFRDIFCALFRPPILNAAVDIIAENIPDLEALNLEDNKLNMLDHLKVIPQKLKSLKILYLQNNKIFMLNSLDSLKGLPLVELNVDGNPFKKRIRDSAVLTSEIKKKFPKLVKLDGVDLGPTIGFDVADDIPASTNIPQWKQLFLSNPAGLDLVSKFLEQYFMLYDSDNRQQLLEAYHEHAMLSITATNNQHYTQEERLINYWKCGRNLLHPKGYEHRFSSLKRGKLNVVALLNELPPSRHDPQSFAVDLTVFTPQMIVLTVTGIFKERNSNPKNEFVRVFQKTLVIVPNNNGFCIMNELLHVNNAPPYQAKNAFKTPIVAPSTLAPASAQPVAVAGPDDVTKIQMVQAMSQQSNMNLDWSRKCLEETNWDFQRAGFVFTELMKQNKIPPEAFAK